jgi:hypothetical protein
MTTEEYLNRIKTKCQELLANAEKRTPGTWDSQVYDVGAAEKEARIFLPSSDPSRLWQRTTLATTERYNTHDAIFIASCAGAAEAGWLATVAAIDLLEYAADIGTGHYTPLATEAAQKIIAAWPEELLK